MRLTWRAGAFRELRRIYAYNARDNPTAAREIVERIEAAAAELAAHPQLGEEAGRPNYRTKYVPQSHYRLFYRILPARDEVRIVRVRDVRRRPLK
jgi:plasmid stabilization system protein ParE